VPADDGVGSIASDPPETLLTTIPRIRLIASLALAPALAAAVALPTRTLAQTRPGCHKPAPAAAAPTCAVLARTTAAHAETAAGRDAHKPKGHHHKRARHTRRRSRRRAGVHGSTGATVPAAACEEGTEAAASEECDHADGGSVSQPLCADGSFPTVEAGGSLQCDDGSEPTCEGGASPVLIAEGSTPVCEAAPEGEGQGQG
jgi:hypothetical protein